MEEDQNRRAPKRQVQVNGLGFGVDGFGFRVQGVGLRVGVSRVQDLEISRFEETLPVDPKYRAEKCDVDYMFFVV